MRSISVLGATGSIGCSTLDVIRQMPEQYEVFALAANTSVAKLAAQIIEFKPHYAVMVDKAAAVQLQDCLGKQQGRTEILSGTQALIDVAQHPDVDMLMAAIVGAAGLASTLAAAYAGKRILLANKESLVIGGELLLQAVAQSHAELIPIDSEHNAIFQSLPHDFDGNLHASGIKKLLLTASGGPFWQTQLSEFASITPEQAVAHPNWSMGAKISVDSATMMNKGLELIEASLLFNCPASQIEVLIHPQSIVHSMVEYIDGSVIAQLGVPDMRTPIAFGLGYPQRIASGVASLNFQQLADLQFHKPDSQKFPALDLARYACQQGRSVPTVLNAANEIAVAAFLAEQIGFKDIISCVEQVVNKHQPMQVEHLEDLLAIDNQARLQAQAYLK